jgi:hypothetical protein
MNAKQWSSTLFLALGLSACGTEKNLGHEVSLRTASMVKGALKSSRAAENHAGLQTFTGGLNALQQALRPGATGSPTNGSGYQAPPDSTDAQIDELARFLEERVFIEQNLESRYGGVLTYRIRGDVACAGMAASQRTTCILQMDVLQPRVRVSVLPSDQIALMFLLGPTQAQPLDLLVGHDSLTFTFNLDAITSLLGGGGIGGTPAFKANGKVRFALSRSGEDYAFAMGIPSEVRLEVADPQRGKFSFSTAAREFIASLRIEAATRTLSQEFDLGETHVSWPASAMGGTSYTGAMALDLPGFSYAWSAAPGVSEVQISNIGFGDAQARWTLDGATLVGVDLNPASGRRLDLTFAQGAANEHLVRLEPELDVVVRFALGLLPGQSSAAAFRDAEYRFRVADAKVPTLALLSDPSAIKVLAGRLTFESLRTPVSTVSVEAGSCLGTRESSDPSASLVSQVQSQACP